MKRTLLLLAVFVVSMGFSYAEEVWVRAYLIQDSKRPIHKGLTRSTVILPKGCEIKSYGPVERSEIIERKGLVNILFPSQQAYEAGVSKEEIDSAIAEKIAEGQAKS